MGPCNYKIKIGDKEHILNEHEFKGYLLQEGLDKFTNEGTIKQKPSTISVIQPGEIKQPETITIKPKENAIPIGSSEEIHVGETPRDSQPVGEGIPESGETAGTQEPAISKEESATPGQEGQPIGVHAEQPPTVLSYRGLQEVANEFGYDDVKPRDRVTDVQERANAEQTANEWASKGEYQKNIDDMLSKIADKEMVPTAKQRLILEQYLANERQTLRDIKNKLTPEYDAQLAKVEKIKEIGQIARGEAGAALRLPGGGSVPHPILDEDTAMTAKKEANAVDTLTDAQKEEVLKQVEAYKKASDEASAKVVQLEEQVAQLEAAKEVKKVVSTTKRTKKTTEERQAYRKSEIEAAREALRKLRSGESGLSAVPLPGVRELMAIAPHVKNIMVDLAEQGITELGEIVKRIHGDFKDVLDGITEKDIHNIIAGEFNEKRKPLSVLQQQIKDLQDEAKYINQLEGLMRGMEPKGERAKVERNQKIKELKGKIKDFKKEEAESNKFYGESDSGERKLGNLMDELERIQARREKEKPASGSKEEKEISTREKELRDKIKDAQAEWDKERESGRQSSADYKRMETERNRQLQRVSDLKNKLDELQKGIKTKGQAKNKKVDTPEIEALKKQVNDAETELNKTVVTQKRINKLEDELRRLKERKEKEPKEVEKKEITDREAKLKGQIEEERKAFEKEVREQNKFAKEELDDDAKKLISIRKRNERAAKEIKDKIAKGEFEKEIKKSIFDREDVKKNYPRLRKDALDAIAKKEDKQHEYDLALLNDEMKRMTKKEKVADLGGKLLHTFKSLMAGIDDSATFVQNGLVMLANPKLGAKAWLEHWKDAVGTNWKEAFSDKRFKRELAALHNSADWDIIKNSGVAIEEPQSPTAEKVSEMFEKNLLAKKFKIDGKEYQPWQYTGGVFERAFTSMGNNMRVLLFRKRMLQLLNEGKTFESHPDEYKAAGRVVNELTGRGKQNKYLELANPIVSPIIWAPKMLASTINTLGLSDLAVGIMGKKIGAKIGTEGYYRTLTPAQRKFALMQLGQGIGVGVAIMGAAALGGAKVDSDPYSVTFGDIIAGDHHYNVFGRFAPVVKTIVQVASGRRASKAGINDLDNPKYGGKTRLSVLGGFVRGKVTPAVGTTMNLIEGKDYFTQKPFGMKDVPGSLIQPMSIKDLRDGWNNDGTLSLLNRFLPAFEGIKTTDERDFKKQNQSNSGGGAGASGKYSKPTKQGKLSKTKK